MLDSNQQSIANVSLRAAFCYWLRLGFISFGGPAGQIAIMHRELVEERHWISEARFLHALNYCMLLPGPEAQQLATYIGWLLHRTLGGVMAGALFVLPSFGLLVVLSFVYLRYGDQPLILALFAGLKPAVVALVALAAVRIGRRVFRNLPLFCLAAAAFIAVRVLHAPFPLVLGIAAALGCIGGAAAPRLFAPAAAHSTSEPPDASDIEYAHTRFRLGRFCLVLGAGAALWLLPMAGFYREVGWSAQYTQLGWFFSKAALLTFGGAYAVLPYVYQGAVMHYGWLSMAQMMDGLALGETTPGPLIMIVTFVGFVAGYQGGPLAPVSPLWAGLVSATIATWFTFLPSFIFILAGGPLVESTRASVRLAAPMTAMTAAIVGVIANLALFFAMHTIWPQGAFDAWSALLSLAAFVALWRFQTSVPLVLLACAGAGALTLAL